MEEKDRFERLMMEMGILDSAPREPPQQVEITVTHIEVKIPGDADGRIRI